MANNVSANTLFHFTPEYKYLISILENGFYPRYCMEDLSLYIESEELKFSALPMVCFCDIPLTQVSTHIKHYGEYAIGLKKEWGINTHGITPISYIHNTSMLYNYITQAYEDLYKLNEVVKQGLKPNDGNALIPIMQNVINSVLYFKPYKGFKWNKRKKDFDKNKAIIFYNEREWRYIPSFVIEENFRTLLPQKEYENLSSLVDYNKRLEEKKLTFKPTDIKYIIVSKNKEIPDMIEKLEDIMKQKYALKDRDVKLLITKITSMEQIRKDF